VREYGSGAALFGYTKLYGQVPGGQAEYLRVPLADYNHMRVGDDLPDDRYLFLSDILPTAWQGVEYADVPGGGTLAVMGLGPVGQFVARIGVHRGYRVLAIDKQLSLRMGQCNVKRWIDDLLPLVEDPADPLGVMDLVTHHAPRTTHHAPLEDAPALYETFQKKQDGCIKVVLTPRG
jgi:threonine dehydrogenase-like Zn-dependent dehydrogenase